jgi:hypothetical protein
MKRNYSILVTEHGDEYELCQVDTNPDKIVKAAMAQTTKIGHINTRKYIKARFVDNLKPDADTELQIEMPLS